MEDISLLDYEKGFKTLTQAAFSIHKNMSSTDLYQTLFARKMLNETGVTKKAINKLFLASITIYGIGVYRTKVMILLHPDYVKELKEEFSKFYIKKSKKHNK
jgi:hypothetical protein